MSAQPGHPLPPTGSRPERGVTATAFAVLRRHRGALASATARVVGLTGLAGLLTTAAIFALAWPVFTTMRNERIRYHRLEDPYFHDHTDLALIAVCTLPLFLLPLGAGSAVLQTVCTRAVAAGAEGPAGTDTPTGRQWRVLAVYALRGLIVWPMPLLALVVSERYTGDQLDTPTPLERGTWPYTLVAAAPAAALAVAVLLRLTLTLDPAAASAGLRCRFQLVCPTSCISSLVLGPTRVDFRHTSAKRRGHRCTSWDETGFAR